MTETLERLLGSDAIRLFGTGLLTALLTALYAYTFLHFLRRNRSRAFERRDQLFEALTHGLKNGAVRSFDELVNIYKGVWDLGSEDLTYRAGLSRRLRQFLVRLVSGEIKTDEDQLTQWKDKISEFIRQNDAASPYADLPAVERGIISDISAFLAANDTAAIARKLGELASTIQAREDDMQRVRSMNRWSVPLAIVGLVLTIVFGVVSIIR
jgi:hypothetical protein